MTRIASCGEIFAQSQAIFVAAISSPTDLAVGCVARSLQREKVVLPQVATGPIALPAWQQADVCAKTMLALGCSAARFGRLDAGVTSIGLPRNWSTRCTGPVEANYSPTPTMSHVQTRGPTCSGGHRLVRYGQADVNNYLRPLR